MATVTLSSKRTIVVPREALQALSLQPGARFEVVVRGDAIILIRSPRKPAQALRGAGSGLYGRNHLDRERRSW